MKLPCVLSPARKLKFLTGILVVLGSLAVRLAAENAADPTKVDHCDPVVLKADPRLNLHIGAERLVMANGLQPSMICTAKGTLIVQAQRTDPPQPSKRISYPCEIGTVVSRDGGATWTEFPRKPGENGLNFEGGVIQLRSGRILALDTYITPGKTDGTGEGQIYSSDDDWHTLQGPVDNAFSIPGINYHGSTDDYGRPHAAARLHRRLLELPNGDLLTTVYCWFHGDESPVYYMPTLWKGRTILLRSSDQGRNWRLVSTIAAAAKLTPEGFGEPVLVRVSRGPHAGRLRCYMRTGRDLYETWSDDEGATWVTLRPVNLGVVDIHRTQDWAELFHGVVDKDGKPIDLEGAFVDPDVIELRSGVLVLAVGARIPARASWPRAGYPRNGDYLAFSLDHGETWSHVVQLVSGVLTTHYMAIEETPTNNELFVTYDLGDWASGKGRSIFGRPLKLEVAVASAVTPEIHAYWEKTRAQLASEPMEAVVEQLKEPLPYRKYRVTLRGLDGVHFRALLALPVQGESKARPLPAIVTMPGYGGTQQGVMLSECMRGYAVLQIFPRSQGESEELWKIDGPDKLTWHIAQPEGAYYQGAFADVIRGIDYLVTREDIDVARIGLVGTSQGGGMALAVTAIDPRVKVVVAHVPFLCDMRQAARTPHAMIKGVLDKAGLNTDAALRTLDYFDPLQLAPDLRVPALISAGGKDETCPAATIRAVFDRLPGTKSLMFYPDLPHTSCAAFYEMTWPWLDVYLRR